MVASVALTPAPTPEFTVLAALCRTQFRDDPPPAPDIPSNLDWDRLVRLARFHRVQGLAAQGAPSLPVPDAVAARLASEATEIVRQNLVLLDASRRIDAAFASAQIPVLFVKGLTVAALAYRQPMSKMGWDIDILVAPGDLAPAADVLESLGYSVRFPLRARSRSGLLRWHRRRKESVWSNGSATVELHSRLADQPALIPAIDARRPSRRVAITPTVALPTLGDEDLFAYLTVHGASSAWFRLKWITDLAALIHDRTPAEIETLYRRAVALGAGRAPAIALLLAEAVHGVSLGPLGAELRADRSAKLAASAWHQLAGAAEPTEPTGRRFGTWRIHALNLRLKPGPGFLVRDLVRQLRDAVG